MIYDTIIIGGGASGMMAAISAGRHAANTGKKILLLEQKEKAGKKILATGNGKCNYTNADMDLSHFYGAPELLTVISERFTEKDTVSFFRELGIFPKEREGYYYPHSEQAASVVWALETEIRRLGVEIRTKAKVTGLDKKGKVFRIYLQNQKEPVNAGKVIIACGLKASPKLGSDGSMLPVIRSLGHTVKPVLPCLCGFYAEGMNFKEAAGVRTDAVITFAGKGKILAEDKGEIQFTEYGISGIPVFQVSHMLSLDLNRGKKCHVLLNLLPDFSKEELVKELKERKVRYASFSCESLLMGILPQKLIPSLLLRAGIQMTDKVRTVTEEKLGMLAESLFAFELTITKVRDYEFAQVCTGGIPAAEINPDTLESRLVPGLYFCGEVLDIDGICGGYNLQWAWSSGYLAGLQG